MNSLELLRLLRNLRCAIYGPGQRLTGCALGRSCSCSDRSLDRLLQSQPIPLRLVLSSSGGAPDLWHWPEWPVLSHWGCFEMILNAMVGGLVKGAYVRTTLEIPFNFPIYLGQTHRSQSLAARSQELRSRGLSWVKIGKRLKISE